MHKYFKTDGIRGKVNESIINNHTLFIIGSSLKLFNEDQVIVAHDTRKSSVSLAYSLISGILKENINVIYKGVATTPSIIYESQTKETLAIIITASHNPYYDNGIKIVYKGKKINDYYINLIENYIDLYEHSNSNTYFGDLTNDTNLEYEEFIKNFLIKTEKIKIVYDLANGSAVRFKHLFDNEIINYYPNGYNINNKCGSTHITLLQDYLKINNYDLGISFDGDADRIIICTKDKILDGNTLLYVLSKHFKKTNQLKNNTIVTTHMANIGLLKSLEKNNINYLLTDVGDHNVLKLLEENNLSLGAESSGHIITSKNKTGDGILVSQIFLEILKTNDYNIEKLLGDLDLYPEVHKNIKTKNKDLIITNKKINNIINNFDGKIILRKSGTEDLLRLTIMHKENDKLNEAYYKIMSIIESIDN